MPSLNCLRRISADAGNGIAQFLMRTAKAVCVCRTVLLLIVAAQRAVPATVHIAGILLHEYDDRLSIHTFFSFDVSCVSMFDLYISISAPSFTCSNFLMIFSIPQFIESTPEKPQRISLQFSLSGNPAAHETTAGFLVYILRKERKEEKSKNGNI